MNAVKGLIKVSITDTFILQGVYVHTCVVRNREQAQVPHGCKNDKQWCNHSDTPEPRLFKKASQQAVGPRAGKATSPILRPSAKSWDKLKDTLGKG